MTALSHTFPAVRSSAEDAATAAFAGEVRFYLSQQPRQLPSRYLYDPLGSALFEAITRLPWYQVTRAELELLHGHGHAILQRPEPPARLVELGSGSGEKLATLLAAGNPSGPSIDLHLIDVSPAALAAASQALGTAGGARVTAHQASYEDGLEEVRRSPRPAGRTLAMFLGSNIGNFDPAESLRLLTRLRRTLAPGDELLIGVDLVKPEQDLLLAYDDPLGITAAFNRNLLVRINRELDGRIDLSGFAHRASWNADASRIEMHLVSSRRQRLVIHRAGLDITMEEGETIWTESSYKFDRDTLGALLASSGFTPEAQWVDERARFALTLARA
jgi:L-histidine Nalpha-methyltransferase